MKIAHVTCAFPPYKSGISNVAYNYARIQSEKNNVVVFVPDYGGDKTKSYSFKVEYLKPFPRFGRGGFLYQLVFKLKKFDIVHLHYPFFGGAELVWLLKSFGAKFKLVLHYHMDTSNLALIPKILSIPSVLIRKSIFNKADAVIYASDDYIKNSKIKKIYNKYKTKFYEIPFGVDTNKFQYLPKQNHKKKIILFVAALDKAHYFKGLDVLFKAVVSMKLDFELRIVGDGDLKQDYISKSKELKIDHSIKFLGKLPDKDLVRQYQEADLFILPSINRHEAFGLVLLEAMACGTPVIATNLPGVRKVFNHNEEGFLVKINDENDLKDKMNLILNDEKLWKTMSNNALNLVETKYSWLAVLKQITIINKIITNNENLLNK